MEISRIKHDGINYVLADDRFKCENKWVPYIYLSVTTKSSRKVRYKRSCNKDDGHFSLISINNPIKLFNIIYNDLKTYLEPFDYLAISPYSDDITKRERVYLMVLSKLGFTYNYVYQDREYNIYDIIVSRKSIKNKQLNTIKNALKIEYFG